MWRIGIAGGFLAAGASALGLILLEGAGHVRPQPVELAARQVPAVASDASATTVAYGSDHGSPLAQGLRDQLRRELFGAAVPGRASAQTSDAATGEPAMAARVPGTGAGATGDIPPSMSAMLPTADEPATAGEATRSTRAGASAPQVPEATAPLQLSPALPRPRTEAVAFPAAPRSSSPARPDTAEAAPVASKGAAGDPQVAEAQRLLAILGYAPGAADGRAGRQTTAAVRAYEKASGLPQDGRIDAAMLGRLRKDMRTPPSTVAAAPPASSATTKPSTSLTERILGGVQRLIARDLDSARAPAQLAAYCATRSDEWIYDRGQDRMRLCGEINGSGRIAYRPLPGDR